MDCDLLIPCMHTEFWEISKNAYVKNLVQYFKKFLNQPALRLQHSNDDDFIQIKPHNYNIPWAETPSKRSYSF